MFHVFFFTVFTFHSLLCYIYNLVTFVSTFLHVLYFYSFLHFYLLCSHICTFLFFTILHVLHVFPPFVSFTFLHSYNFTSFPFLQMFMFSLFYHAPPCFVYIYSFSFVICVFFLFGVSF